MSEHVHDEGLTELEAALAGLAPRPPALDRDRLLFRAGQESARRGRLWPWATGLLAAVAAGLGALLVLRPGPPPVERIVYVPVKEEAPPVRAAADRPTAPAAADSDVPAATGEADRARLAAFRLRREVLRWGLDALPAPQPGRDTAPPGSVPPRPTEAPRYYQLRVALNAGGGL
jgi:hypothetical protein